MSDDAAPSEDEEGPENVRRLLARYATLAADGGKDSASEAEQTEVPQTRILSIEV